MWLLAGQELREVVAVALEPLGFFAAGGHDDPGFHGRCRIDVGQSDHQLAVVLAGGRCPRVGQLLQEFGAYRTVEAGADVPEDQLSGLPAVK